MNSTIWIRLLVFIFLKENGLGNDLSLNRNASLSVLEEVVLGPVSGRNLVLYLDPEIINDLEPFITSLSDHGRGSILVSISNNGSLWCQQQTAEVLRGSAFIHVVIYEQNPVSFFQSMPSQWNPSYLLLYSFRKESYQLLSDDCFRGIDKVALMEPLEPKHGSSNQKRGIFSLFPFAKERPLRLIRIWDSDMMTAELEDVFVDRFQTFEGYEFQLGTWFDDYPYLYQSETEPDGFGDGVEVEMLDAMARVLNYSYNMTTISPDEEWGAFENESWTGMLGMVHRKEKNFTVNYFVITSERVSHFDASVSYWMEGFGLAMVLPPPLPKWRGVYYPFAFTVWLGVLLCIILIIFLLTAQDQIQPEPFLKTYGRTWPYVLRATFNQSLPTLPKAQWQRLFVGCWILYCLIINIAYTANLVAFITIPVFPKKIQTVEQLAESDYGVIMCDYGEFVPGALKTSQDPYYRAIGERLELAVYYEEAIGPMLEGTHALIESYSYSRILITVDYEARNSYMLQDQLYPGHLCWYFQKNTAWKYKFDELIQSLVESGLIAYWVKVKTESFLGRDFERRQESESKEIKDGPLTMEHLQGPFFILIMSWSMNVVVFVGEVVCGRLSKVRNTVKK